MTHPESIENRWDILYRDYPEVYDAFVSVPYHPSLFDQVPEIIDMRGKIIADVGAGTGKSSLAMAKISREVIGIEVEPAMLLQASQQAEAQGLANLKFVCGNALSIPLAANAVDLVTGFTLALFPAAQYREFIREGLRVARKQVVYVGIPPGWYGGELNDIIENPYKGTIDLEMDRIFIGEFHFQYQDVFSIQEYGTIDNIVNLYGFIFGKKVIDHLKKENKTSIRWKFRVYWRE